MTTNQFEQWNGHMPAPNPELYDRTRLFFEKRFYPFLGGISAFGANNLPGPGESGMVISNHDSWTDVPITHLTVFNATGAQMRMLAKDKLWDPHRFVGTRLGEHLEACGALPTDRDAGPGQQSFTDELEELIDNGSVLGGFIQKTRKNHERGTIPAKSVFDGLSLIALKHGLPVTPAAITGQRNLFPVVVYQPKIPVEKIDFDMADRRQLVEVRREYAKDLTEDVRQSIEDGITIAVERRKEVIRSMPKRLLRKVLLT